MTFIKCLKCCHSATLRQINPKIEHILPITTVHNPKRFHENCSSTFRVILFTDRQTNTRIDMITLPPCRGNQLPSVVTCEIKLFCDNFEIISVIYFTYNHWWWQMWIAYIKHWNNFKIISEFYFTCNHIWNWNKNISAAKTVLKLFQHYFSDIENMK